MALYDVKTFSVSGMTGGMAPFSDSKIYVGKSNGIGIYDSSFNLTSTISLGGYSVNNLLMSKDLTRLYALSNGYIKVINTSTDTVVDSIYLTTSIDYDWAITPSGQKIYGTYGGPGNLGVGSLVIVNLSASPATVTSTNPGSISLPRGITCSPDGTKVYVSSYGNHTLSVFNADTGVYIKQIMGMDSYPQVGGAMTQSKKLYITCGAGGVRLVNTTTDTAGSLISGSYSWDMALSPDDKTLYTFGFTSSTALIDTSTDTVFKTIQLPGQATTGAFTPSGKTLFAFDHDAPGPIYAIESAVAPPSSFFTMF